MRLFAFKSAKLKLLLFSILHFVTVGLCAYMIFTRLYPDNPAESFYVSTEYYSQMDYSRFWSLDQYRSSVKKDKQSEAWDEIEKSVLASVADDVIVGVKGTQADIIIVKKFA